MVDSSIIFIQEIRKKFQSPETRRQLLSLMVDEIKFDRMKKEGQKVSFSEAVKTLENEIDIMKKNAL